MVHIRLLLRTFGETFTVGEGVEVEVGVGHLRQRGRKSLLTWGLPSVYFFYISPSSQEKVDNNVLGCKV